MQINREELSNHYASLSDDELRAIDPNDLTELALQCYDGEVDRRQLWAEPEPEDVMPPAATHTGVHPDWFDTAATACVFQAGTARRYAEDADRARTILSQAGIPSQVVREHQDDGSPDCLAVMVPGALSMKAISILDRDLFNQEEEEIWTNHFDRLTDDELRSLHPDDLCAGLLDRAARLRRVYAETLARRNGEAE